jgi:EAL domain-containing protein (putative c-di-GMP-specific phosphodiesterase class I)
VQDHGTRIALTALACDSFQGYLFSQPLTADEVSAQLAAVG